MSAVDGGLVLALRGLDVDWRELTPEYAGDEVLDEDDAAPFADALIAEYALVYDGGRRPARRRIPQSASTKPAGTGCCATGPSARWSAESGAGGRTRLRRRRWRRTETDAAGFASALEIPAPRRRQALVDAKEPAARAFALQAAGLAQAGASVFRGGGSAALPGLPA